MWWFFRKLYEDEDIVRYAYACESYETDGELIHRKGDKFAESVKDSITTSSEYAVVRALRQFYSVVKNGFPDTKMVACG